MKTKEPMIGVSILIVGTSTGTVTDFDGQLYAECRKAIKNQFSYIRIQKLRLVAIPANGTTLNVQMKSDSQSLERCRCHRIWYRNVKSDLTGSVTNVSSKDFNMGLVSSPEQLINGKISGVYRH